MLKAAKGKNLRAILLSAIAFWVMLVLGAGAQEGENESANVEIDTVDAEARILEQTGLQPINGSFEKAYLCNCRKHYGGVLGVRWRLRTRCHARCVGKLGISNLNVVKVKQIRYEKPNQNILPNHQGLKNVEVINCSSERKTLEDKVIVTEGESVTSRSKTILEKVDHWETALMLSAKEKETLGVQLSAKASRNIKVETTNGNTFTKTETVLTEKPISLSIPPWTAYWITYMDTRKEVTIPVNIEVVLDGDVEERHAVYDLKKKVLTGEIANQDHWSPGGRQGKLSELIRQDAGRTLMVNAVIQVSGSERDIKTTIAEKMLTENSEECVELLKDP